MHRVEFGDHTLIGVICDEHRALPAEHPNLKDMPLTISPMQGNERFAECMFCVVHRVEARAALQKYEIDR